VLAQSASDTTSQPRPPIYDWLTFLRHIKWNILEKNKTVQSRNIRKKYVT